MNKTRSKEFQLKIKQPSFINNIIMVLHNYVYYIILYRSGLLKHLKGLLYTKFRSGPDLNWVSSDIVGRAAGWADGTESIIL